MPFLLIALASPPAAVGAGATGEGAPGERGIAVRISAPAAPMRAGRALRVEVSLTNNSGRSVKVRYPGEGAAPRHWAMSPYWWAGHPLRLTRIDEGDVETQAFRSWCKGLLITDTPQKTLAPGETLSFGVDLRALFFFLLPEDGRYRLELLGTELEFEVLPAEGILLRTVSSEPRGRSGCPAWQCEYAVTASPREGEYLLLGRGRNSPYYAVLRLPFRPELLECRLVRPGVLVAMAYGGGLYVLHPGSSGLSAEADRRIRTGGGQGELTAVSSPGLERIVRAGSYGSDELYEVEVRTRRGARTLHFMTHRWRLVALTRETASGPEHLARLRELAARTDPEVSAAAVRALGAIGALVPPPAENDVPRPRNRGAFHALLLIVIAGGALGAAAVFWELRQMRRLQQLRAS